MLGDDLPYELGVAGGHRPGVVLARGRRRPGRDRGLPRGRGRPRRAAADAVHRLHRQQLPARGRRHPRLRLQPLPCHAVRRPRRPATTTRTSGYTSTTCSCRPASTSTSRAGCSDESGANAVPGACPRPTTSGAAPGLPRLLPRRGREQARGPDRRRAHRLGRAVGVDTVGAGPPPGERRASLAGVGLPRRADRRAVARRGRGRRVDHPRAARRRAWRCCSTTRPRARARSWRRTT